VPLYFIHFILWILSDLPHGGAQESLIVCHIGGLNSSFKVVVVLTSEIMQGGF
jgi:hypothetical protein